MGGGSDFKNVLKLCCKIKSFNLNTYYFIKSNCKMSKILLKYVLKGNNLYKNVLQQFVDMFSKINKPHICFIKAVLSQRVGCDQAKA